MLYPEIFVKPKDDYMKVLMLEMLDNFGEAATQATQDEEDGPTEIVSYLGNIHISPLARSWNPRDEAQSRQEEPTEKQGGRRLARNRSPQSSSGTPDHRREFAKMMYVYRKKNVESAEQQIQKQALLEALFQTQIWDQPYVRENPFIYITPRSQDFETETGQQLKSQFKKIFFTAFHKYKSIIDKVMPDEFYVERKKNTEELERIIKE